MEMLAVTLMGAFDKSTPLGGQQGAVFGCDYRPTEILRCSLPTLNTLCQGEAGLRDQLALFHVYHNFVLPHASLRQPLLLPEATKGRGSAKVWRACTPAMAA